jgi:hypothetical protein
MPYHSPLFGLSGMVVSCCPLSGGLERWPVFSPWWVPEVERRLERRWVARLSSRPLFDGWLACLTSSQRVPLCGKADTKRMGLVVVKLVVFAHL